VERGVDRAEDEEAASLGHLGRRLGVAMPEVLPEATLGVRGGVEDPASLVESANWPSTGGAEGVSGVNGTSDRQANNSS